MIYVNGHWSLAGKVTFLRIKVISSGNNLIIILVLCIL